LGISYPKVTAHLTKVIVDDITEDELFARGIGISLCS
jgi:hypothetical protein